MQVLENVQEPSRTHERESHGRFYPIPPHPRIHARTSSHSVACTSSVSSHLETCLIPPHPMWKKYHSRLKAVVQLSNYFVPRYTCWAAVRRRTRTVARSGARCILQRCCTSPMNSSMGWETSTWNTLCLVIKRSKTMVSAVRKLHLWCSIQGGEQKPTNITGELHFKVWRGNCNFWWVEMSCTRKGTHTHIFQC